MGRKRDFNFDDMLGTGAEKPRLEDSSSSATRNTGIQVPGDGVANADSGPAEVDQKPENPEIRVSRNTDACIPVDKDLQIPVDTEIQDTGDTALQVPVVEASSSDLVQVLLSAHAGLRTGTAKKATFDFTPEFSRALKRWSADTDISMRDLVVRAVAQVIPRRYLQEYRNTEVQD